MLNMTQVEWVKQQLLTNKKISRNQCLREYISRLGAIIDILKKQGRKFEARYEKFQSKYGWSGRDYIYYLTKKGE